MNIDQIEINLCRQMAVVNLIKKSSDKAKHIACSDYYGLFGSFAQRMVDVKNQNKVTARLEKYLRTILTKGV